MRKIMKINSRKKRYLEQFDFVTLFLEEMGWHSFDIYPFDVQVEGEIYTIRPIANIGNFAAFECSPSPSGQLPGSVKRKKIEKEVAKQYRENLIIFVDKAKKEQIWQWINRDKNREVARNARYVKGHSLQLLLQKIRQMTFTIDDLDETGNTHLSAVRHRVMDALDVEKVTKRFYESFTKERKNLQKFIKGIPDNDIQEWYVSVLLNRIMFIYFIQKKEYLNGDINYLRNKLNEMKEKGLDFYRDFLVQLFFSGFAKKDYERDQETNVLLGKIPYLNGGLFAVHQIERKFPDIQIEAKAFENIFTFFEKHDWHLDNNPLRNGNEINPDVIGYIFEKYINQKQIGAYYTQEDVTDYMVRATIIPYLFEGIMKHNPNAQDRMIALMKGNPERYIYFSQKKGLDEELPEHIKGGIGDVPKRDQWNSTAPSEFANDIELWREVVYRRTKVEKNIKKMRNGEFKSIEDLISHNVNHFQLLLDYIDSMETPREIYNLYERLKKISVLDPTCGSGAFLFAALNVLETLNIALLEKMEVKISDWESSLPAGTEESVVKVKNEIATISQYKNRDYSIYKSIIINNLYGVDIMEEATEICKLRLFLKLIAQTNDANDIEPLPDIDFNIRAGNTLVGFGTVNEAKVAIGQTFDVDNIEEKVDKDSITISFLYEKFRELQKDPGYDTRDLNRIKLELQTRLEELASTLNGYLAVQEYGIDTQNKEAYENWQEVYKPFHWFSEFYNVINKKGFDVIIGNPPYIQKNKIDYRVLNYDTATLQDIYAPCVEKSVKHLLSEEGYFSMIIPVSSVSTPDYEPLRKVFNQSKRDIFASSYGERPSKLFNGVDKRVTILTATSKRSEQKVFTTKYRRWVAKERPFLLEDIYYVEVIPNLFGISCYPKIGSEIESSIICKMKSVKKSIIIFASRRVTDYPVLYTRKLRYFIQFFLNPPKIYDKDNNLQLPTELKKLYFNTQEHQLAALAVLNSSLFFWYFISFSDARNVNTLQIKNFPVNFDTMSKSVIKELVELGVEMVENLEANSRFITQKDKRIQSFQPRFSKVVVDKIDRVLAQHYEFSPEETDFIINHDVKYRMGLTDVKEEE